MIVEIADKRHVAVFKKLDLSTVDPADHLAQRPDALAQEDQFALQAVDLVHGVLIRIIEHFFFQRLDPVPDLFQHHEIVVDDHIEDGVAEVVGAAGAQAGALHLHPFADVIEDIPLPFLKADQKI